MVLVMKPFHAILPQQAWARKSIPLFASMTLALLLTPLLIAADDNESADPENDSDSRYQHRDDHDPDGIGKFYMGREISRVMGHRGAAWLERPERKKQEHPDQLVEELNLKKGQSVADIGAGTGYFTRRLASAVGPKGTVYAVDIQTEMLKLLKKNLEEAGIEHVKTIHGTVTDPKLPKATLDLVLLVDVYHEFSHPYEMLKSIWTALKPGGRVVFAEYRAEDPSIPIKPLHKMTEAQVIKEAQVLPFEWIRTSEVLPRQHLIFFRKKNEG